MTLLFNDSLGYIREDARNRRVLDRSVVALLSLILVIPLTVLPSLSREGQASRILFWGHQPDRDKMSQLKAVGVKSLVCLRTNPRHKDEKFAESIGMKWFHVKTGVIKKPTRVEMEKFLSIVGNPENQPVYIFCVGGRDRTSFYLELYRMAFEGWNIDQVRDELKCHELRRKWPTFWFYDDVLENNREWIKDYVAHHHLKTIKTQAISSRSCPCANIKAVGADSGERTQVTATRSAINRDSASGASDAGASGNHELSRQRD